MEVFGFLEHDNWQRLLLFEKCKEKRVVVCLKVNWMQNAKCLPSFLISNKLIHWALYCSCRCSCRWSDNRSTRWKPLSGRALSRACAFFNTKSHHRGNYTAHTATQQQWLPQYVASGQDESFSMKTGGKNTRVCLFRISKTESNRFNKLSPTCDPPGSGGVWHCGLSALAPAISSHDNCKCISKIHTHTHRHWHSCTQRTQHIADCIDVHFGQHFIKGLPPCASVSSFFSARNCTVGWSFHIKGVEIIINF